VARHSQSVGTHDHLVVEAWIVTRRIVRRVVVGRVVVSRFGPRWPLSPR
jgi:hypothetical protein